MTTWVLRIVTNAGALAVATWIFAGITITAATTPQRVLTLLAVALLFGIVNTFLRPVVAFLSLPLYLLTLGLMFFLVNALMLKVTSWLAEALGIGFRVDGFWTLIGGSVVISLVSWLLGRVLGDDD
jgi:putative membrane protein